jgi:predicted dehydrogenase
MTNPGARKVKVGVVGCGVVATAYYLPYLANMDTVDLVAVCDRFATRTQACARLFGANEQYLDYHEMIDRADIEAVFILTAPGTHVPFALRAITAGKHVLLQKPMATDLGAARQIAAAVRQAGVKALIEPSSGTPLDPDVALLRQLVKQGVLGDVQSFSLAHTGPTTYGPSLGNNPYGQDAFYTQDSGGFLFDFPYGPLQIVGVLGPCKSVMASARISSAENYIVPEHHYDAFLAQATDPERANYWDVVLDLPRTQRVQMEAYDNVYSLYEMADGAIGTCQLGRIHHPVLPGAGGGSLVCLVRGWCQSAILARGGFACYREAGHGGHRSASGVAPVWVTSSVDCRPRPHGHFSRASCSSLGGTGFSSSPGASLAKPQF